MVSIYVLKLEENKYYVGKSQNVYNRIQNHFNGSGTVWTKKYKPIDIVEVIPNCSDFDEDKYTKIYMSKYGIDNVRGGAYVTTNLRHIEKKILEKEMNGVNERCFKCGKEGHYADICDEVNACIELYEKDYKEYGENIVNTPSTMNLDMLDTSNVNKYCTRCGSNEHTILDSICNNSFDEDLMRKIRGNYNYILHRFESLKVSINRDGRFTCKYCNKYFCKQKYLYYHCLTSCEHKEKIMNELRDVEITIQ